MKVLVCGGRDYSDREQLFRVMDYLNKKHLLERVIHGDARGADTLAGEWAAERKVLCEAYPADWEAHGRAAGPRRNRQMLDLGRPDLVLAFPGGAGTADMVRVARERGFKVIEAPRGRA